MTLIRSLLAATDFSDPSRPAACRAARLASAAGARLHRVHAVSGSAMAQLEQLLGSVTKHVLVESAGDVLVASSKAA